LVLLVLLLFKSVVGSFWCVGVKWVVEQANNSKEKKKGNRRRNSASTPQHGRFC
jgi:hypothetical protein